jgi:Flp pilus assembly protein TadD
VRSIVLVGDGRIREAVRAAREATDRGPNNWAAWLALSHVERAAGNHAAAGTAIARARHLNPLLNEAQG